MDRFITEILHPFRKPSEDARLVLFADETIHAEESDLQSYLGLCAKYAAKYKVHLCTGLFIHDEQLYLCLLDTRGSVICLQPAVHLALSLQSTLTPAAEIQVVHTELGNICLCVDADIFHPQIIRAAALKGADFVISIQHIESVGDPPNRLMCSVWNAAQSNNLYVINLSGSSCTVSCPAPLTRAHDGYLLRRTSAVPARFGLNMPRLDEIRSSFQLMDSLNRQLIRRYADKLER